MSDRKVEVVDSDPKWPVAFADEAAGLCSIFGSGLVSVYHVGSTSVPGLAAKPIIDILVVLRETETISHFDGAMRGLGYRVRGECLDAVVPGTPGRFYFSKDTMGERTHHVHVCAAGHSEVADKLAFRDYLRAHPREAAEYGQLKKQLALEYPRDTIGYIRGKDRRVKSLLTAAREWVGASATKAPNV